MSIKKIRYRIWYTIFKLFSQQNKTIRPKPNNVLFLCHPGIGDVILTTPIFTAFKNKFPYAIIDVITSTKGALILQNNPALNQIFSRISRKLNIKELPFIRQIRKKNYDYIIDLCDWSSPGRLLKIKLFGGKQKLRLRNTSVENNRGETESWNVYDHVVEADQTDHFSIYQSAILKFFNIQIEQYEYKIYLSSEQARQQIKKLNLTSPIVFLNFGGSRINNSLCFTQVEYILNTIISNFPSAKIIFNTFNIHWFKTYKNIIKNLSNQILILSDIKISTLVEWIKHSDLVIGTDSGSSHIATACNVKQIIFSLSSNNDTQYFIPMYGEYCSIRLDENSIDNLKDFPTILKRMLGK